MTDHRSARPLARTRAKARADAGQAMLAAEPFSEWMVTGRDSDGNAQRLVLHASGFLQAASDALATADLNWGPRFSIDSIVRQGGPS